MTNQIQRKALVVVYSYHHNNTGKIANIFAKVLDSDLKTPDQVIPEELQAYELIGFGSGIYSAKHHKFLLDLADKLPPATNKPAFIFSTDGTPRSLLKYDTALNESMQKNHSLLREKLQSKGYTIVDEFNCAGLNTNAFLKWFGGINKDRPNDEDLKHAEEFAQNLKKKYL